MKMHRSSFPPGKPDSSFVGKAVFLEVAGWFFGDRGFNQTLLQSRMKIIRAESMSMLDLGCLTQLPGRSVTFLKDDQ
jgi:hypothetical protein